MDRRTRRVNSSLTSEASVNIFKSIAVCVAVVVICGSDISAETPPTATKATPVKLAESTNSIGMKFRLIPAGTFTMGKGDEARKVTVTQPFKMGVHEVTQAQYEQVMGVNPSHFKGADNPVEKVNWFDAVEFCRKLSALPAEKAAGNVYRLPTAAEWEYAGRAGTATQYTWGDDASQLGDYAWYSSNSARTTHPVGGKQPNAWGLYDMTGNVMEWCHDSPAYGGGVLRVLRGGKWDQDADKIKRRADYRYGIFGSRAVYGGSGTGFRVSLSPSGK
jgi:formylglycine-generating enzyme required for sulfatase activity